MAATAFLPAMMVSRLFQVQIVSILSISSLVATAYILIFIPNTNGAAGSGQARTTGTAAFSKNGPLERYLSTLNGGLSFLLSLSAYSVKGKHGVHEGFWLLCLLPFGRSYALQARRRYANIVLVVFFIIMLARQLMLSVDIDELEKLKYGYKGA